jgi:hypothetical protein
MARIQPLLGLLVMQAASHLWHLPAQCQNLAGIQHFHMWKQEWERAACILPVQCLDTLIGNNGKHLNLGPSVHYSSTDKHQIINK